MRLQPPSHSNCIHVTHNIVPLTSGHGRDLSSELDLIGQFKLIELVKQELLGASPSIIKLSTRLGGWGEGGGGPGQTIA